MKILLSLNLSLSWAFRSISYYLSNWVISSKHFHSVLEASQEQHRREARHLRLYRVGSWNSYDIPLSTLNVLPLGKG